MKKKAFVLGANTFGLKFAENDIIIFINSISNCGFEIIRPKLSRTTVFEEFDELVDKADKNDFLIFYFSGHANLKRGDLDLIINEGELDKRKNYVELKYFTDGFINCRANQKLVILDCCNANPSSEEWRPQQSDKYRLLTASERLEQAKEIEEFQASFLTYHLSLGLSKEYKEVVFNNKILINNIYDWLLIQTNLFNQTNLSYPVPVPNLLGNQKNNFEIAQFDQIITNSKSTEQRLSAKKIAVIAENIVETNELFYFTDELELEGLYDKNVKLYNQIFKVFFDKLSKIPHLRQIQPSILFNRILSFENLEDIDILSISRVRNSTDFLWHERCIIVSALTISLLNRLDEGKLNLLIDFLTDFENEVWQRALVGIILCLKGRDNLLKSYPKIIQRIKGLQFAPNIFDSIEIILHILRNESYSLQRQIEKYGVEQILNRTLPIFTYFESENSRKTDKVELSELKQTLTDALLEIAKNEINVFGIDYQNFSFLKKPQNWFLPFYSENNLLKTKLLEEDNNIDIGEFLSKMEDNLLIDNIDKYYLCLSEDGNNEEDIKFINLFGSIEGIAKLFDLAGGYNLPYDPLRLIYYLKRIREYYKYTCLFSVNELKNAFTDVHDIYNSSLIDLIVNESEKFKILGDEEWKDGLVFEAIEFYCEALKHDEKNVRVLLALSDCLFEIGFKAEALTVYLEINALSPDIPKVIKKIASCYMSLNNYFESWTFFLKSNRLSPDDLDSVLFLGLYHFNRYEYKLAARFLSEAYKISPNDIFINEKLVKVHIILGDHAKAYSYIMNLKFLKPSYRYKYE